MGSNHYVAFISNGRELSVSLAEEIVELELHDQVIQSDECTCTHKEHISNCEIEHVAVDVEDSKKRITKYIIEMAFCTECGAYYIPQESYEYLTQRGITTHHIKGGVRLFEYMKSGDAYEEEKKHLAKIEKSLNVEYNNLPKPISRYAIDDGCGGLFDVQSQKYAAKSIYEKQDKISAMMAEPYVGRIDVSDNGNDRKTYYIGRTEDKMIGGILVYSIWSEQGRLFSHTSEATGSLNGANKQVDLRRKIDIMSGNLRGVEDVFSSNSEFAEKGIYDKFLIQVLMSRKKSHQLTDIIATIQDKQNEIIEKACVANLIVQGCAGSGKTMVMLHRLSFWLYNNKSLKPGKIKILTPNENFNVHIGGLHSQLNLREIEIMSVEQYYAMLLRRYDDGIASFKKIDEEENINERFLNYIYSKAFVKKFSALYKKELENFVRDEELGFLKECAEKCGLRYEAKSSADGDVIVETVRLVHEILNKNSIADKKLERIQGKVKKYEDIIEKATERREKAQATILQYKETYKDGLAHVLNSAMQKVLEDTQILEEQKNESLNKSLVRILNGSDFRQEEIALEKIQELIDENVKKQNAFRLCLDDILKADSIDEAVDIVNLRKTTKEDKFIVEYLAGYRKEKRANFEQQAIIDKAKIDKAEEEKKIQLIDLLLSVNEINQLKELAKKYSRDIVLKIFNSIFDQTIEEKLIELNMKRPEKTYRYELYTRVFFSELFWKKVVGSDELICVDEGQDVSYCEYERIIAQNEKNHAYYNVFGDLNQRIKQGRGLKTWEQLKRKLLAHEYLLNENYRNTNQITQYCNDVFNFDMTLTGVEGEPVRNITFEEMLVELVDISDTADRTAIIIPRTMSKQRIIKAKNIEKVKERFSTRFNFSKFSIMYVDEVKGIEFDRVYVIDQDMEKNERYIAFTRALDNLTIVY